MQPWNFKGTGKFREGNKSGVINLEFLACYSLDLETERHTLLAEEMEQSAPPQTYTGPWQRLPDSSNSRAQTPRDSKVHKTQSGHRLSQEGPGATLDSLRI